MGEETKKIEVNQDSEEPKDKSLSNGPDSTGAESIGASDEGIKPKSSPTHASERKKRCNSKCKPAELWAIITNVILVFVTGFGVWVFYEQWDEMHQATVDSEKAMRINERAWVAPSIPEKSGTDSSISITIHNSGRTFAGVFRVAAYAEIQKDGSDPTILNFTSQEEQSANLGIGGLLPPGGDYVETIECSNEAIEPFPSQEDTIVRKLFVHGLIRYRDIFGDECWTKFCFVYLPSEKRFTYWKTHNQEGTGIPQ